MRREGEERESEWGGRVSGEGESVSGEGEERV